MTKIPGHTHTNRELELMLVDRKPLSMFCEFEFELPEEDFFAEKQISEYVASGKFIRSEVSLNKGFIEKLGEDGVLKYVLFCYPNEQCRISAMRVLKEQHAKSSQ